MRIANCELVLWGQIDPEEDAEGATQFLFEQAKAAVKEAAMPLIKTSSHQMHKAQIYKQQTAKQNSFDDLENF